MIKDKCCASYNINNYGDKYVKIIHISNTFIDKSLRFSPELFDTSYIISSITNKEEEIVYISIRLMNDNRRQYERDNYPHSVQL